MKNIFYPCKLVEHKDYYSIILSDFHLFDDYWEDKGGGGYSVERLAKKLIKEHKVEKGISFDSEAGLFCAYAKDQGLLMQLCELFRTITGEEDINDEPSLPKIPLNEAEKLLLKGFIVSLDKEAQSLFLDSVPYPQLNRRQQALIEAIGSDDNLEIINAAKKINSEARTITRRWDNYLSHPQTISILLEAIDKTTDKKVNQELVWALVFICSRHLPDLRVKPYFIKALEDKDATTRWLGVMGLKELIECPEELLEKATTDKSKKVRECAEKALQFGRMHTKTFPSWMFNKENYIFE